MTVMNPGRCLVSQVLPASLTWMDIYLYIEMKADNIDNAVDQHNDVFRNECKRLLSHAEFSSNHCLNSLT